MKFNNPKFYTLFIGVVMFLFGFLGFAFNGVFNLPDSYLFVSLVLGFWGIVVWLNNRSK